MAKQDQVIGQRRVISLVPNLHFSPGHDHSLVVQHSHASKDPARNFGPDLGLAPIGYSEISSAQRINRAYFLPPVVDQDIALLHCEVVEYHNVYDQDQDQDQMHESKYDVVNENALDIGEHGESIINGLDSVMESHDRQFNLASEDDELGFRESNDLDVIDGATSSPNLSIQQPRYVIASPILQSRSLTPASTHELTVGQEFPDVKSCRMAVRDMAIAKHFEIQTVKSDKTRFTAKCASEGCPWRVHAAKLPGVPTFTIRTIHSEHKCGGIAHLGHQQASVQWVASSVEKHLRENPHYQPKEILEEIHRVHGITLSYKQAWRGKERFMASLRGSFEEDYRLLPQYCKQIRQTNPGSMTSICVNPVDNSFLRLFISYQASICGFVNACRPLIGLDKTVLKNKYLGSVLFATGFDGDGMLFPLAFGVVDEDNDENWMWFLAELHNLLETNTENMPRITILSNRQKHIVHAVESNFPTAFHGFCILHLSESFRKEFNNSVLVNLLWESANALTVSDFDTKIMEIERISHDAAYWVRRIPPRLWAASHFEGKRFGHMTSIINDTLNSLILEASGLPIVQMMECIRRQLMIWFNERREASLQWTSLLVASAERRVSEALELAHTHQVLRANEAEFEVISHEGTNTVDIRNRCCLCRGWQLYGLPCSHAVAALLSCRQNVQRFTESCFTVATYRKAYSQTIHPVPDRTLWQEMSEGQHSESSNEEIVVNPPKSLRPPGQPRKRRTSMGDRAQAKRIVRCSRCNQTGHFRTTCATPI